jgi:hypothetical protein
MLDIDDLMVVTAASSLPPKWDNFKQALGVAMMGYADQSELQLTALEMQTCLDCCSGIMHQSSSNPEDVANRRMYCSGFAVGDFYDNASESEKTLLLACRNQILDRQEEIHRLIASDPTLHPWNRAR